MSRAIHAKLTEAEAIKLCADLDLNYSVVEPLLSGGTRIVMDNSADMETLRARLKTKVIAGPVIRCGSYVSRIPIPYS